MMLARGSRHKCCGGSQPICVSQVNLWEDGLSLDEVDDPDGTIPVDSEYDDNVNAFMISGEGSVTVKVTDVIDTVHVYAHITSLVSGSAGVTIRRIDSDDSISLWWLGGTSYELRQGSTVLESIVGSGLTAKMKLELSTPLSTTTDVLVYINDVLVHTEIGVAFTLPDILNLGLVVSGEASVIELEVKPCYIPCRLSDYVCSDLGLPTFWKVEASGIGNPTGTPIPCSDGVTTFDPCVVLNGTYRCANQRRVVANFEGPGSEPAWFIDPFGTGPNTLWPYCVFPSTMPGPFAAYSEMATSGGMKPLPPVPLGKLPYMGRGINGANDTLPPPYDCEGDLRSSGYSVTTMAGTCEVGVDTEPGGTPLEDGFGNPLARVHVVFRMMVDDTPEPWWVTIRYSKDFRIDTTDFLTDNLTLDFESSDGCGSYPSTVTIIPDPVDTDEDKTYAKMLLGCERSDCTPPVAPQLGSCYIINITLADEDGGVWEYQLPLGVQFNENTGGWEWSGGTLGDYPYIHDTCGPLPDFDIKIHCVESEEGEAKQWVLDFTTDDSSDRFPMTWQDESQTLPEFEGETGLMCSGETWDFYAHNFHLATENLEFGTCEWPPCGSSNIGPIIPAHIEAICSGEIGSEGGSGPLVFMASPGLPTNVDPNDVDGTSFFAPLPSGLNDGVVTSAYLYVENGTAKVQLTDSSGNPVPDMTATISYSCDPSDGKPAIGDTTQVTYLWGFPSPYTTNQFGLCDGESSGFGWWQVTFP